MPREEPAPAELEATLMIVWPTIGATSVGRWVGRLAGVRLGAGGVFTLGNLLAVLTLPVSLAVFAWQLLPFVARRYRITDRRIVIQKGLSDGPSVGLDEFDAVDVDVLPGQAWLRAGEVIFRRDRREVFRLSGVSRPEIFRHVCLEARTAMTSVHQVLEEQAAET